MDPFEEFEFKPLTDGLGFHKNKKETSEGEVFKLNENLRSEIANKEFINSSAFDGIVGAPMTTETAETAETSATSLSRSVASLTSSQMSEAHKTQDPLSEVSFPQLPRKPQKNTKKEPKESPSSNAVNEVLKKLNEKKLDFTEKAIEDKQTISNLKKARTQTYISTTHNFSASFLDFMLIIALNLLCLIILLLNTKIDLVSNLANPDSSKLLYWGLAGIYASITFTYLVVNRVFLGFTPGEWVFDLRLGRPEQLGSAYYTLMISFRSLIVIATGLLTLPILSMIVGKDLIGRFLDVEILRKV